MKFRVTPNGAIVYMDDGSRAYAKRVPGGLYIVTVGSGPGPDPTPGGDLPDEWTITNGELTFTLQRKNLEYALEIYNICKEEKEGEQLRKLAAMCFMCTFVEAPPILIYANSNVPESLNYPHDAVGSDGESVGIYQQQAQYGWGSNAELMTIDYSTRAFIGGPNGPNSGNPPGILDKSDWNTNPSWGSVVQSVQVSAYPDRYESWKTAALDLVDMLASLGQNTGWVWPYPLSEVTSEFNPPDRPDGHYGMDFSGAHSSTTGAPIPCAADGVVRSILRVTDGTHGFGNGITITHADNSYTLYGHMYQVPTLEVGATVKVRDTLGGIGNTGGSFGNHLHFETHPDQGTAVNPRGFMADRNATEPAYG